MKRTLPIAFVLILALAAVPAMAQNNPCGGKASMTAMNPCNPCAKGMVHFHVDDPMGRNSVTFRSEAPLEDIVGTTSGITGYLVFDPAHPDKGGYGELSVSIAGLNTGIPLRDEHLRSADWLNADKYPDIKLHIKELKDIKKFKSSDDFQTYDIVAVGEMSFNGRTKMVSMPSRLTYLKETEQTKQRMPGDLLAARADFDIRLADFGVTGPKGAGLIGSKVGESIGIEVSIMGSNAMEMMAKASNPCGDKAAMNPCGGKAAINPCGDKAVMNPCNPCSGKTPVVANPSSDK